MTDGVLVMSPDSQDLRDVGLKVTQPRMRILEIMQVRQDEHLSAEDVYRILIDNNEEIGLATVYRVLTQFEAAGLVKKHNFDDGKAVFELDTGEHHDHMIDVQTGEVIEFFDDELEELQHRIAEKHGYIIEDHSLVLYVRKK